MWLFLSPTLSPAVIQFSVIVLFCILVDIGEWKFIFVYVLCYVFFRFERPDFPQFFSGATPLVGRFVIPCVYP